MATIKDVARMAGVSIATVSNYLNQTKPVSREAASKVQAAVEALQYSPNLSAKSLKSNAYTDIGIILPNFDDSYYVQIFQGIENAFQNTGYFTNLAFSYDIPDFEQAILHNFLKKQIQGLILISCQPNSWEFYHQYVTSKGHPLVLIDRDIRNLDANFVSFDTRSMIRHITGQLLDQGLRQLFLISGPQAFECESGCMRGFQDAFQSTGLLSSPAQLLQTNLSREDAFRKTIQLFRNQTPEALVATSESVAAGTIEAINLLGYTTEEIPVLTLGEAHWNLYTHSFATRSLPRPAIKLGQTAAALLLDQLKSPLTKENERVILENTAPLGTRCPDRQKLPLCQRPLPDRQKLPLCQRPLPDRQKLPLCQRPPLLRQEHAHSEKVLRILMVDTPQVHTLLGLLRNFENRRHLKTQVSIVPHHQLYEEILSTDRSCDVIMYDIPWLSALASHGILEDLTPELKNMDLDIFFPDCLNYFCRFQDRYFGLPFMYAPQIFYYRKDLFENTKLKTAYERQNSITLRPPLTLKEFNTIADFFTNHTDAIAYGLSVPAAYDECLAPELYMRLRAFGGRLFDEAGQACLDQDATLKAYINFLRSVRLAKPDYRTATDITAVQDFLKGDTAMLITYPSFLTDVADLRKSSMTGSIGWHHIPGRSPLLGGWSLGVSSRTSQKQEALSFLQWICEEQIANYFALLGGQTAITSTYINDELVKLYPWLPLYHSTYQYTKPTLPPELPDHTILSQNDIDAVVCRWVYELLEEKLQVQEAIARTQAELEELVKGCRNKL
ncbi:MAG: extracellular solute-binding protein [Lachnospiraceae bacterium]|jgi:multiple sugar transport system substrate-binding protein|nr:extracellular solute-binding protein [Lachnospiraceae bacterium]